MRLLWTADTAYEAFDGGEYNEIIDNGDTVLLPYSGHRDGDTRFINYIALDKRTGRRMKNVPPETKAIIPPEKIFYDKKRYIFGDKEIRTTGARLRVECLKNGNLLWKFDAWAYLYTDIIEKDGCIIFGTDGNGSRLYCLDLETSKPLSETKTNFSGFYDFREFNWHNGNLVVYGKYALTVVDPFTGAIIDERSIPKSYPYRNFLKVIDGYAYCCVMTDDHRHSIFCFAL